MRYWAELRKQPVVVSGSSSGPKVADGREEKGWRGRGAVTDRFQRAQAPGRMSRGLLQIQKRGRGGRENLQAAPGRPRLPAAALPPRFAALEPHWRGGLVLLPA